MTQGAIKNRKTTPSSSSRSKSGSKKGHRTIAPKTPKLVAQRGITKKYTAGLTGKTERALAEKAGHLEMLGGGKAGKGKGKGMKEKEGKGEKDKKKGKGEKSADMAGKG